MVDPSFALAQFIAACGKVKDLPF
jgi:hypothetical protein